VASWWPTGRRELKRGSALNRRPVGDLASGASQAGYLGGRISEALPVRTCCYRREDSMVPLTASACQPGVLGIGGHD
jgi:hypothetical protein